jgi:hypothetical protein
LVSRIYVLEYKHPNDSWILVFKSVFETKEKAQEAIKKYLEGFPTDLKETFKEKYRIAEFKRAD